MPYLALDPSVAEDAPPLSYGAPDTAALHPAGKSLLAIRTRLILELGNRTDIPIPIWNEWINDSYQDLHSALELAESKRSFAYNVVVDQQLYLLPTTVDTVRSVTIRDTTSIQGVSLEKTDSSTFRKLPARCGVPEFWFREQNMIVLWPTPDDTYQITIDAWLKPAPLVLDGDYPILEDKWHETVLNGGKARAWTGVQNDTKAALTEQRLAGQVQRRSDRDDRDNENAYPAVRPVRTRADIMSLHRNITSEPGE